MTAKNLEFKVGLFVMTGIFVLAASLYWLEGYKFQKTTRTVDVKFADVGMLKIGNIVTVSGVFKGKVDKMTLTEDGVNVRLLMAGDVVLKKDARFIIRNFGLMGERFVAAYPGEDSQLLSDDAVVRGTYDSGIPEVMGLMGEMVTELHSLVLALKRTIGSDSTLDKFNRTVANLENVSGSLADYLHRSEGKLDETADNFLRASRQLSNLLAKNSPRIDSSLERFNEISVQIQEVVARLDTLSVSARLFADRLNNPDGTLNMFLEDGSLYEDLRRTADNIEDLIRDIKANPRKYINLKFELF